MRQTTGFACAPIVDNGERPIEPMAGPTTTHVVAVTEAEDIVATFPTLPPQLVCWEARSRSDGQGQEWGRRAQFCFHSPTGAMVFRRVLGVARIEVLVVNDVSSTVQPDDLEPK